MKKSGIVIRSETLTEIINIKERRINMSERQARKERKGVSEAQVQKKPVDKVMLSINIILTVVVVAVLGLGAYAVAPTFKAKIEQRQAEKAAAQEQAQAQAEAQKTVADYIAEKGITFDDFKAEYGLTENQDVTEETPVEALSWQFSIENYAKYNEKTVEELKAENGLGDDVDNTITWNDATNLMTVATVAEKLSGMDFETFKTSMGLPEDITAESKWGDVVAIMQAQQEAAAQAQTEATAESTADSQTETEAAGE